MIKTLAVHIKGFIRESILTPLFMVLEVVMETIIPLLMAKKCDTASFTGLVLRMKQGRNTSRLKIF